MARKTYSEHEREQVREALLTTALQCIVDRGLIHSSIEVLCRKVGISKSFFYTFFASKEELVLEALRYQQPKLLQYARQLMEDPALDVHDFVVGRDSLPIPLDANDDVFFRIGRSMSRLYIGVFRTLTTVNYALH